MQDIDEFCQRKKNKFFAKVKWEAQVIKCIETYPKCEAIPQPDKGDLRCKFCFEKWSTHILNLSGEPYDPMTLEYRELSELRQNKFAACDDCKQKVCLFANLAHQKFNFFIKCGERVS